MSTEKFKPYIAADSTASTMHSQQSARRLPTQRQEAAASAAVWRFAGYAWCWRCCLPRCFC